MIHIVLLGRMAASFAAELSRRLRPAHTLTAIPDLSRFESFAAEMVRAQVLIGWPLTDALMAMLPISNWRRRPARSRN